jgi:integral membrane protein (TIGR01906 family)
VVSATAARRIAAPLVAAATIVAIVAGAVALFFNPVWVALEQDRTGVAAIIGFTPEEVRRVTNSILAEFVFGPGTFAVEADGRPVLNARERGHMADVRAVVVAFAALAIASIVVLAVAARSARGDGWFWRAVAVGAAVLAGSMLVAGAVVALFFEAAFEFFHRVLFPAGSYTFDPATERLVQLFPMPFWSETSIALAIVLFALSLGVTVIALRRLPRHDGVVERPSAPMAAT